MQQIRYSIFSGLSGSGDGRVGCKYNFLSNTQALRLATKISSSLSGLFQRHIRDLFHMFYVDNFRNYKLNGWMVQVGLIILKQTQLRSHSE